MHSETFSTGSVLLQIIFTKSSYILALNGTFHISNINYPQVVWSDPEAKKALSEHWILYRFSSVRIEREQCSKNSHQCSHQAMALYKHYYSFPHCLAVAALPSRSWAPIQPSLFKKNKEGCGSVFLFLSPSKDFGETFEKPPWNFISLNLTIVRFTPDHTATLTAEHCAWHTGPFLVPSQDLQASAQICHLNHRL